MKIVVGILCLAGFLAGSGCATYDDTASTEGVLSARDFSEQSEAEAQRIYRNGQAKNMSEARLKAAGQVNSNWAAESRRVEKKRAQAKFSKELSKLDLK